MAESRLVSLRDEWASARREAVRGITQRMIDGDLTLAGWHAEMRDELKLAHGGEYMLGRGGKNAMTPGDWGIVGRHSKAHYDFLDRFADDLAAGKLSPAQAMVRASMYPGSSFVSFERARSEAHGMPRLPVYPGDGGTPCLTNCRCHWVIREYKRRWVASWTLGPVEHCSGCLSRRSTYASYTIAKPAESKAKEAG